MDENLEKKITDRFNIPLNEDYTVKKFLFPNNKKINKKTIISLSLSFLTICLLVICLFVVIRVNKNNDYTTDKANSIIVYNACRDMFNFLNKDFLFEKRIKNSDLDSFIVSDIQNYYLYTNEQDLEKYEVDGKVNVVLCSVSAFDKDYETIIFIGNGVYDVYGKDNEKYLNNLTFSGTSFSKSEGQSIPMAFEQNDDTSLCFTYNGRNIVVVEDLNYDIDEDFIVKNITRTNITVEQSGNYPTTIQMVKPFTAYPNSLINVKGYLRDGYIFATSVTLKEYSLINETLIYSSYDNGLLIGENHDGRKLGRITENTKIYYNDIQITIDDFINTDKDKIIMKVEGYLTYITNYNTVYFYDVHEIADYHETINDYSWKDGVLTYSYADKMYSLNTNNTLTLTTDGELGEFNEQTNIPLMLIGYQFDNVVTVVKIVQSINKTYEEGEGQVTHVYQETASSNGGFDIRDGKYVYSLDNVYLIKVIKTDPITNELVTVIGSIDDINRDDYVSYKGYMKDLVFYCTEVIVTKYVRPIEESPEFFRHLGYLTTKNDYLIINKYGICYDLKVDDDLAHMLNKMVVVAGNIIDGVYKISIVSELNETSLTGLLETNGSDALSIITSDKESVGIKKSLLTNVIYKDQVYDLTNLPKYSQITIDGYIYLDDIYAEVITVRNIATTMVSTTTSDYRYVSYKNNILLLDDLNTLERISYNTEDIYLTYGNKSIRLSDLDHRYIISLTIETTKHPIYTINKVIEGKVSSTSNDYNLIDYLTYYNFVQDNILVTLNKEVQKEFRLKPDIKYFDLNGNLVDYHSYNSGDKVLLKVRIYADGFMEEIDSVKLLASKETLVSEKTETGIVTSVQNSGKVFTFEDNVIHIITNDVIVQNIDRIRVYDELKLNYLCSDSYGMEVLTLEKVERITKTDIRKVNLYISKSLYLSLDIQLNTTYELPVFYDEAQNKLSWINSDYSFLSGEEITITDDIDLTLNYQSDFEFIYDNEVTITKTNNHYVTFVPETILGRKVTKIDSFISYSDEITISKYVNYISNNAFAGGASIKHIYFLSETPITLGDNAFKYCLTLKTIDFNNQEIITGEGVFENCNELEEIKTIGISGVTKNLFYNCQLIRNVTLKDVTTIGENCFYNNICLESVVLSDNVKKIEQNAFSDCQSLKTINLENIEEIGKYAFSANYQLENVNLLKIVNIGDGAFEGCKNLKTFAMGKDLVNVGRFILYDVSNLECLEVPFIGLLRSFNFHLGVYFNESQFENSYLAGSDYLPISLSKVIVTDDSIVHERNFEGAKYITDIIYEKKITQIDSFGFYGCGIKEFTVTKDITYIGFKGLAKLDAVIIIEEGVNTSKFNKSWNVNK